MSLVISAVPVDSSVPDSGTTPSTDDSGDTGGTTTPTPPSLKAVPLYSSCAHQEVGDDSYAVCVNGTCLCQTSYYEKDLVCCELKCLLNA